MDQASKNMLRSMSPARQDLDKSLDGDGFFRNREIGGETKD